MSDIHRPTDQEIEEAVREVPFKEIEARVVTDGASPCEYAAAVASRIAGEVMHLVKKRGAPHIAIMSGLASMFETGVLIGIQIGRTRQARDQQGRVQ